ncbi:unnamed protein product [Angiostrongylus costaricensis]|uniref:AMP_N domain-containing protein n=1 Tax=Angiostrongylus costaricensis TaxID=334426 RepID=A0A0R3PTD0_ANGCS|nr:unnamed protein product [Angiostrongylus costaricensis]
MRRHWAGRDEETPAFNAVYISGEEPLLFLGICDSRGVDSVGVPVNTSLAMNIGPVEQRTTQKGRLRLKRCASIPALTIFIVYAPTLSYDEDKTK